MNNEISAMVNDSVMDDIQAIVDLFDLTDLRIITDTEAK